jgi:hypothetical protein
LDGKGLHSIFCQNLLVIVLVDVIRGLDVFAVGLQILLSKVGSTHNKGNLSKMEVIVIEGPQLPTKTLLSRS